MRKKVLGLFVLISIVMFASFVFSDTQDDYASEISKAFQCLDDKVDNSPSLSLEEAVFASLAGASENKTNATINGKKIGDCWGQSGSCNAKQTAQVILAKKQKNENVSSAVSWLKSQSGAIQGLTWFLQITMNNNLAGDCIIRYGSTEASVSVGEDLKLSGSIGSCLEFANSNYWLKIKEACLDDVFKISCNNDFKTNLLYQDSAGGTIYVSSETSDGSASGWTEEEISARCFKEGTSCNYETSLWAVSALENAGEDTSNFVPFLRALAPSNKQYFPSAFLRVIEGINFNEDLYPGLINERKPGGMWDVAGSDYSEYYDSALAMLALGSGRGGADAPELAGSTVPELFNRQESSGCWGNVRDTAFILYASQWERSVLNRECNDGIDNDRDGLVDYPEDSGCSDRSDDSESDSDGPPDIILPNICIDGEWYDNSSVKKDTKTERGYCHLETDRSDWPKGCCKSGYECKYSSGNESESICEYVGGGTTPSLQTDCELANKYCVADADSCIGVGGVPDYTYNCHNFQERCCNVDAPEENCAGKGGRVCDYDREDCSGSIEIASDGTCCLDLCVTRETGCSVDSDCNPGEGCSGGECVGGASSGCSSDDDCLDGERCVEEKCVEKGGSWWWFVFIFIILIGLVLFGIVYRDRLRVWWFKMSGKARVSKINPRGPPGAVGEMMARRPMPRFGSPRGLPQKMPVQRATLDKVPVKKSLNQKDKEMEETLKKLREMSE
ncbi:MAG: hypothetical protein ABIG28_03245 [archaeon]